MNLINFIFTGLLGFGSAASDVKTVPYVDLTKYLGQWYEIASIPQSFQKKCVKNTGANYSIDEKSGYIVVLNTCVEDNGKTKVAEGRAKIEDTQSQAKLKVTFVKLGGWIFTFGGDYWVIGLQKDYKWAVVGAPNADYAWILSRTQKMSKADLKEAHAVLKQNGYDTCTVLTSVQDNSNSKRERLCDLF